MRTPRKRWRPVDFGATTTIGLPMTEAPEELGMGDDGDDTLLAELEDRNTDVPAEPDEVDRPDGT